MTDIEKKEFRNLRQDLFALNEIQVSRYYELLAKEQAEYVKDNQEKFNLFYQTYIQGKKFEDIDPDNWDFYSDWHKDMYGFRPKCI